MATDKTYLTSEGREQLERELRQLIEVQRPEIAQKLKEAVAQGDLKENADYHDAKERQGFIEGKIQDIEVKLRTAVIIERDDNSDIVQIGDTVTIREDGTKEDETYTIVGAAEAQPTEGKISNESPIGKALLGAKKGDKVVVQTPDGKIKFKVRKIGG
jgi:transcription elongation factor GreA